MQLIVNADDFGTSEPINNAILSLMASGHVTSTTLIANAPSFEHAVRGLRDFPQCSFGIHLNLTVFAPLGPSAGLEPILNERGHLTNKLFQVRVTPELRAAAERELTLQVQRVYDAGVPVSHFDSHQHIHVIPALFPVIKGLQKKFRQRRVRSTINLLPPEERMAGVRALKKLLYRTALKFFPATSSPDGLGEFRDFHSTIRAGGRPRFRCLELMVHPGTDNPLYNAEIGMLLSDWRTLLPADTALVSYHAV